MRKNPIFVNVIVSAVLGTVGAFSYWFSNSYSWISLIPAGVGTIFLTLTPYVRKENHTVVHFLVGLSVLTFLAGLVMTIVTLLGGAAQGGETGRQALVYGVMAASGLFATVMYIQSLDYWHVLRDDLREGRHQPEH